MLFNIAEKNSPIFGDRSISHPAFASVALQLPAVARVAIRLGAREGFREEDGMRVSLVVDNLHFLLMIVAPASTMLVILAPINFVPFNCG